MLSLVPRLGQGPDFTLSTMVSKYMLLGDYSKLNDFFFFFWQNLVTNSNFLTKWCLFVSFWWRKWIQFVTKTYYMVMKLIFRQLKVPLSVTKSSFLKSIFRRRNSYFVTKSPNPRRIIFLLKNLMLFEINNTKFFI